MASSASACAYAVVPADLDRDRDAILGIWARNLSSTEKLGEKFAWHFLSNPYGEGRCWLLLANGEPAGTAALGMRPLHAFGETVRAGVACDLAVDKPHRFLRPALMLQKAVLSTVGSGLRLVYGIPNERGAAPIRRAGYADACRFHRYARAIRISPYLARRAPFLAGAAGGLTDAALRLFSALRYRPRRGYRVEIPASFDSRFDDLWNGWKPGYPIAGVRDARYLNWRFAQCPLRSYKTLALISPGSRLAGYIVFYMDGGRMCWADLLSGDRHEDSLQLIAAGLRHAGAAGADSVSVQGSIPPLLISHLESAGFRRRTGSKAEAARLLMTYAAPEIQAGTPLAWYLTSGDEPYN